jgi:hypothetical protein
VRMTEVVVMNGKTGVLGPISTPHLGIRRP